MAVGKLTRPESAPGEPSVAQKIAATFAAEMIDPGTTAETEAVPLQWAEEDALDALRAHPELAFGSTSQRSRTRHELLKKALAETAPVAPAAATPASAATPEGSPEEEGGEDINLSALAQRLAVEPATESKLRRALAELDAAALEQEAVANLYSDVVDSWTWEDEEPADEDGPEGGEAA